MVISCPACGRRFGVSDAAVPPEGRRARCAACGEVFQATPPPCDPAPNPPHYRTILMPGDGLAAESSFVAPLASLGSLPPGPLGGDQEPGGPEWAPAMKNARVATRDDLTGLREEAHSTVAIDPTQLATLRDTLEPAPAPRPWRIRDGRGREAPTEKQDLIRRIREGSLDGDELVFAPGGSEWSRAAEIEELAYYFNIKARSEAAAAEQKEAEARLGAGFAGVLAIAPACLAATLHGFTPLVAVLYASLRLFAEMAPLAGLPIRLALAMFDLLVIEKAASGRPAPTPLPIERPRPADLLRKTGPAAGALAAAFLPLLAFNSLITGSLVLGPPVAREIAASGVVMLAGNMLLWGLTMVYAPMAFGLAATTGSASVPLRPDRVVREIGLVRDEYTAIVLVFILAAAVAALLEALLAGFGSAGWLLAGIVWALLHLARLMLLGRALGSLAGRHPGPRPA